MPATPQFKTQDIVNALLTWRGDVAKTARALGMARNSLYERIERLGLDLAQFRSVGVSRPGTGCATVTGMPGSVARTRSVSGPPARAVPAQKNEKTERVQYQTASPERRLGGMPTMPQVEDEALPPIKTAPPRKHPPLQIEPALRDRLERAAWQLQARYEAATNESLILEQFIEEAFEPWLRSKLEQAAPKRNGRKGGEKA